MARLMYDSTNPRDIPRDAEMVAGYVDGAYAWPQAWWDLFPNARHVKISAIGARTAPVGDVEPGCIWPPENAVPWVRRARADGYDPTIYCNELNDWLNVRRAFWAAGEPEPHYWVARYNGVREIPGGAIARQFAHPHDGDGVANYPWETGAHYDLSIVADYWPGVDGEDDDVSTADDVLNYGLKMVQPDGSEKDGNVREVLRWTDMRQIQVVDLLRDLRKDVDTLKKSGVPVTMTEADRDAIAEKVEARMLSKLGPLFDLARRLES